MVHYHDVEPQGCGFRGIFLLLGIFILVSMFIFIQADEQQEKNTELVCNQEQDRAEMDELRQEIIRLRQEKENLLGYISMVEGQLTQLKEQVVYSP